MPVYDFAFIISVEGLDYNDASAQAVDLADAISATLDAGVTSVIDGQYEYDNDGQRVVYLHDENKPRDDLKSFYVRRYPDHMYGGG